MKENLKDAIITMARSTQESQAALRASENTRRVELEKFKNKLFSEIHKELSSLKDLTVFTNTPFITKMDLRDFTLKTPCGNLSVTNNIVSYVSEKGERKDFPITPTSVVEELKQSILELYKHSIASNLRLAKPGPGGAH